MKKVKASEGGTRREPFHMRVGLVIWPLSNHASSSLIQIWHVTRLVARTTLGQPHVILMVAVQLIVLDIFPSSGDV